MSPSFTKTPSAVKFIETKHRKISTKIPSEHSINTLSSLEKYEPQSMNQELPLVWDKAKGYQIFDSSGNIWIDFSSGIFVTNVGHAHPIVKKAIIDTVENNLLHNYYFPIINIFKWLYASVIFFNLSSYCLLPEFLSG